MERKPLDHRIDSAPYQRKSTKRSTRTGSPAAEGGPSTMSSSVLALYAGQAILQQQICESPMEPVPSYHFQPPPMVFGGKFRVGRQIGSNANVTVYEGIDLRTAESICIKVELGGSSKCGDLGRESTILHSISVHPGFPKWRWFGSEAGFNVLVMEKLGHSLSRLLTICSEVYSLKTTLMLADQCLARLESLHQLGYIHGDVKAGSFVIGLGTFSCNQVFYLGCFCQIFLLGFGHAKRYEDRTTFEHIPETTGNPLKGTIRYASLNAHVGIELSRRDDLESLGYMLIQFLKRRLPWSGVSPQKGEHLHSTVYRVKRATSVESLCNGIPLCFAEYMRYCRDLKFNEIPNYKFLRALFQSEMIRQKYTFDNQYDWVMSTTTFHNAGELLYSYSIASGSQNPSMFAQMP